MADLKRVVELVVEDELSAGMAAATASIEKFDAQVRRSAPTAEGLAAKLDKLTKAEADLAAVQERNVAKRKTLDQGLRELSISADQHARSLQTLAAEEAKAEANLIRVRSAAAGAVTGHDELSKSTQNVAFQMRALTQQMPDIVSGLLTGQKPFMILVQQGGQVVQVMGGVGAALRGVSTYLGGPLVLAGVAAAATIGVLVARSAELANQQRQLDIALRAVGATGVTSSAALAEYVKQLERAGVARATALETTQGLARNPSLTQLDIQRAAQLAPDLAAGLGIEVPEAAKRLADALAGGFDGVKKLDDAINLLSVDQRNAIRVMLEHGDRTKAADVIFDSLSKRFVGLNRDALTPMGVALRDLSNSWSGFMDEIAKSAPVLWAVQKLGESVQGLAMMARGDTGSRPAPPVRPGDAISDQLAGAISQRDGLLERYTAAKQGQGPVLTGPMLQQMESEIGRLSVQIDDLRAKQNAALAAAPAVASTITTAVRPDVITDRNEGLQDPNVMRQRAQAKAVQDATEADRVQIEVLKAGLPTRAAVQARIEATTEAARRGLEGAARTEFIETKVRAATLAAADAAGQNLAATQREAVGLLAVAAAADRGRAAMIVAKAATEAHEQAATQAGVAEAALRDAIINRAAAQEAEKGAEKIRDLREQADSIAALIAAEQKSPQDAYWAKVNEKVRQATISLEAHRDAATDPKIKAALDAEIARIRILIPQVERLTAAYELSQEIAGDEKQIALLQKQVELVGKSADERERELATFKARQEIAGRGGDVNNLTASEQAYINTKVRLADVNSELRKNQNLYDEIANSAVRSLETVGDAISQEFTRGNKAVVNWGNITNGVLSAVMQQAIKLSVVNPILNGLFGGERASIWTALLPSGGAAGAGGGGGSILGQLGQLTGLSNLLPGGGMGGLLAGANSYLFGTPAQAAAIIDPTGIPSAVAGEPGLFGTFGSTSLGQIFGGFGAGFGAGNLLNSLLGGNQTGGMIGSGLGSALGVAASLMIPGVGALIGPLLGGLLGGGVGGLFGPGPAHKGFGFAVRANGGNDGWATGTGLNITDPYYNEEGRAVFEQGTAMVNQLNEFLAANQLTVYGARAIGGSKDGMGGLGYGEAASFQELLASFTFGSSGNADLNRYLQGQRFDDPAKLQAAVQGFNAAQAAIEALTAEAVPAFTASMTEIGTKFDAAVEQAKKYGLSEAALTTARAKAIAALEAQRTETLRQTSVTLNARYLTALGRDDEAALVRQAEAATQELATFTAQLDAFAVSAAEKTDLINRLLVVQATERQRIIEEQTKAVREEWTRFGQSIRSYLDGLASGTAAGASPADRLAAAQATFARDRTLAMGGDRDALGRITQSADALLGAGRDVYASGGGYQALLAQVTSGLSSLPVVQSYDAAMTAALEAIAGAVNGDSLLTSISSSGNVVQISGGVSFQPLIAAVNDTTAAVGDVTSTLVSGLGSVVSATGDVTRTLVNGLGTVVSATGDVTKTLVNGLGLLAAGNVVIAEALVAGQAVLAEIAVVASGASVTGLAALGTLVFDGFGATVTAMGTVGTLVNDRGKDIVSAINTKMPAANDNTGVINALSITNRYLAAVAWNTNLLTGSTGLLISPDPSATAPTRDRSATQNMLAFADGGIPSIVTSPTTAPMALFGESGPEAIMPLMRDSYGRLGVSASGFDLGPLLLQVQALQREVALMRDAMLQIARMAKEDDRKGVDDTVAAINQLRRPLERAVAA